MQPELQSSSIFFTFLALASEPASSSIRKCKSLVPPCPCYWYGRLFCSQISTKVSRPHYYDLLHLHLRGEVAERRWGHCARKRHALALGVSEILYFRKYSLHGVSPRRGLTSIFRSDMSAPRSGRIWTISGKGLSALQAASRGVWP